MYAEHPDPDVHAAIIRLCDALCQWERATGRQSVLILREDHGYVFRAGSGKPDVHESISDAQLLSQLLPPEKAACDPASARFQT